MSGFRVYEPSGKAAPRGLVFTFASGLLGAAVLGVIYAYVTAYNPLMYIPIYFSLIVASIINHIIAPIVGGALVGGVVGFGAKLGHVRAPKKVMALSVLAVLGFLWTRWMFWFRIEGAPDMIWDGVAMVQTLAEVARNEQYILLDSGLPAGVAWTVWGIEAAMVFAFAVTGGARAVSAPYCESRGEWAVKQKDKLALPIPLDADTLRTRLEQGQIDALTPSNRRGSPYELTFHICPSGGDDLWMTVEEISFDLDGDGKTTEKRTTVVKHLNIGPEGFKALVTLLNAAEEPEAPLEDEFEEQRLYAVG